MRIKLRHAEKKDLDQIIMVEEEAFGDLGTEGMASREVMAWRIELCNGREDKYFWVAVTQGMIVAYATVQPTRLGPQDAHSWSEFTDEGTLEKTFDYEGENLFVVSLGLSERRSPPGTADLLAHRFVAAWAARKKKYLIFCSRMPGFAESGLSAEEYWQKKRSDETPHDWMVHEYFEMAGSVEPVRLLKDSYKADIYSGGYSVLFALTEPEKSLQALSERIYRAGLTAGKSLRNIRNKE